MYAMYYCMYYCIIGGLEREEDPGAAAWPLSEWAEVLSVESACI